MVSSLELEATYIVTILIGGKSVLKIGATMGTVIVPFMPLNTEED